MKKIYLDNSATTALDPKVIEAMNKAFSVFGNPSSLHSFGQEARSVVDQSRESVADFLDCQPTEVIFTSGGSESDNLAIKGLIESFENYESRIMNYGKPHIITSAIEHHAVLHTVQELEKEGKIEATYIKPGKNGVIKAPDVESAIKPNTVLISVMYLNNETGCVQPIREIGKMIERQNSIRYKVLSIKDKKEAVDLKSHDTRYIIHNTESKFFSKIYFHTDAVQAAEFFEMGTKYLHVDLLTMTAHKIHGPKGTGVLFVKKGTPILPQITGGDHEFGKRAGTENTAGIAGIAEAIRQVIGYRLSVVSRVARLRDKLENFILKNIPETYLNGDKDLRAPHITNISFKNAEGEAIILNLDFLGIAVSSGSACTSRSLESSHVLSAMGVSDELAHGAIRFSLSRETTEEEIDRVCEVLPGIIEKLRQMSPFQ